MKAKPHHFARRLWMAALLAAGLILGAGVARAQTHPWRDHLTRDDVLKALGEPNSDLRGDGREMMDFNGGLHIELQNGEVTNITGTVPDALKPGAAPAATTATEPTSTASAPAPATAPTPAASSAPTPVAKPPPATPSASTAASTPPAATPAASPAAPATTMTDEQFDDKIINDFSTKSIIPPDTPLSGALDKALGQKPADGSATIPGLSGLLPSASAAAPPPPDSPWTQPNTLQGFIAGLLLRTVVMTLVLKGAFAYKDFPVIWREVAVVGAGVAFCNQSMAFIFTLNEFLKMLGWIQADQILTGMVLLALIMNFTPAKQFPTAAGIMMATMGANIALGYAIQFFL